MINNIPHKDLNDQKAKGNEGRPSDFVDDLTFWQKTKVGRFLSLRTKTSKTILGIITVTAISLVPAPIRALITNLDLLPMEALTDLSILQVAITIAGFLVITGVPFLFKGVRDSAIWTVVKSRVDLLADELVKAVDAESEGGKKVTRNEVVSIIQNVIKGKEE